MPAHFESDRSTEVPTPGTAGASALLDWAASEWSLTLHPDGELLTARAETATLQAIMLGFPRGRNTRQVKAKLTEILRIAADAAHKYQEPKQLPGLLHFALKGLLAWQAEIERKRRSRPVHWLALFACGPDAAFAYIGGETPEVTVGEQPIAPPWVTLEGPEGRTAKAFVLYSTQPVDVRVRWTTLGERGETMSGLATWAGTRLEPVDRPSESRDVDPLAEAELLPLVDRAGTSEEWVGAPSAELAESDGDARDDTSPSERRGGLRGWMDRLLSRRKSDPSIEAMTEIAHDVPGVPDWIPAEPEALSEVSAETSEELRSDRHLELSERAQDELVPLDAGTASDHDTEPQPAMTGVEANAPVELEAVPPEQDESQGPPSAEPVANETDSYDDATTAVRRGGLLRWIDGLLSGRKEEVAHQAPAEIAHDVPGVPEWIPDEPEVARQVTVEADEELHPFWQMEISEDAPDEVGETSETPRAALAVESADLAWEQLRDELADITAASAARWSNDIDTLADDPAPIAHAHVTESRRATIAPQPHDHAADPASESDAASAPNRIPIVGNANEAAEAIAEATAEATDTAEANVSHLDATTVERRTPPPPLRPAWPDVSSQRVPSRLRPRLVALAIVSALFASGWLIGTFQGSSDDPAGPRAALERLLQMVGIAGAQFTCEIVSDPEGAWISVDGKELPERTPARIALAPGEHVVELSLPGRGAEAFAVGGERGQTVNLTAPLRGTLEIRGTSKVPIEVAVDGAVVGLAPITVEDLTPGTHSLSFQGPGVQPWEQTVDVRVNETSQVLARPFEAPETGLVEVRASLGGDQTAGQIDGASVWVDGEHKGKTPLTLELPRGPHSIRVVHGEATAPIQIIELPGGNQRFALFRLGEVDDHPRLELISGPGSVTDDQPGVVSVSVHGLAASEIQEMWMHARTNDGAWRRYPMARLESPSGTVGVSVFPAELVGHGGAARYYASTLTRTGEELFTEIEDTSAKRSRKR